MDQQRSKGLCFNFDDKFHRDHIRKSKLYAFMLINEDPEPTTSVDMEEGVSVEVCENPKINFNALIGQPNLRTITLQGIIDNIPVQILIDGGSTHNFIKLELV